MPAESVRLKRKSMAVDDHQNVLKYILVVYLLETVIYNTYSYVAIYIFYESPDAPINSLKPFIRKANFGQYLIFLGSYR
jgi:hypothetical protein